MNFTWDPNHYAAVINLAAEVERISVELRETAIASVDERGMLVGLELLDTREFGTPFDEAVAERAVAWARAQLNLGTAS